MERSDTVSHSISFPHVVSIDQFLNVDVLHDLFGRAASMAESKDRSSAKGKVLATLFYEPSTRTRLSFESAMIRIGGDVISTESAAQFSSAIKGETLEDSIMTVSSYADAIVLRHPEVGAANRAAAVSVVPILNAGDGRGEHPTQGLLDMYTIQQELGRLDNLHVALMGDLANSRVMHTQVKLLSLYGSNKITLVSPEALVLPDEYKKVLDVAGIEYVETNDLNSVIGDIDILSVNRVQKERLPDSVAYESVKDAFTITPDVVCNMKKDSIVIDPLPRVGTITPAVDTDPRAAYFRQVKNGLHMRMALLDSIFSEKQDVWQ